MRSRSNAYWASSLVVLGVTLIGLYLFVLRDPVAPGADIGAGGVLLLGYIALGLGVIVLLIDLLGRRRR